MKKFEKAKAKLNEAIEKKKIVEDSVTEMQHKLKLVNPEEFPPSQVFKLYLKMKGYTTGGKLKEN